MIQEKWLREGSQWHPHSNGIETAYESHTRRNTFLPRPENPKNNSSLINSAKSLDPLSLLTSEQSTSRHHNRVSYGLAIKRDQGMAHREALQVLHRIPLDALQGRSYKVMLLQL